MAHLLFNGTTKKEKAAKGGNIMAVVLPTGKQLILCATTILAAVSFFYSVYIQNELTSCMKAKAELPGTEAVILSTTGTVITAAPITAPPITAPPVTAPPITSTTTTSAAASPLDLLSSRRIEAESVYEATAKRVKTSSSLVPATASQEEENIISTGCQRLPNGGPISLVWAWDDPPTSKAIQTTIKAISPDNIQVIIYCSSTACMEAAQEATAALSGRDCVSIRYMIAPLLAQGTPLEDWVGDHVLAKILSAHYFEETLQVVMQLVVLYQLGGMILMMGLSNLGETLNSCTEDGVLLWNPLVKSNVIGGGMFAGAAPPQDDTIGELMTKMLVAYQWPTYDATKWPVQIQWNNLCKNIPACKEAQILTQRHGLKIQGTYAVAPKPRRHYGTLSYQARRTYLLSTGNPGMNRGDEMQGLAGLQFLPRLDAFVERDRLDVVSVINSTYFRPNLEVSPSDPPRWAKIPTTVFFNAWWGTPSWVWPPPGKLEPIFVAMHLNSPKAKQDVQKSKEYLNRHWPIGARDTSTQGFFQSIGVHSIFSGCMTMTLLSSFSAEKAAQERTNDILLVDVNQAGTNILPDHIKNHDNLKILSAKLLDQDIVVDQVGRYFQAHDMKMHLQKAKLVITQRLHVALPAASMGTPCILIMDHNLPGGGGQQGLARFSGLQAAVHTVDAAKGSAELAKFNWDDPPPNPNPDVIQLRRNALSVLTLCHNEGDLVDSARKFGVLPSSWEYPKEKDVCTTEDMQESEDPAVIQIATAINPNWVDQEPILASWIHALYKSNQNQKFAFYFLTNDMNPKQRCLVRWMVLRWFPDAKVYTMKMDDALTDLPYLGIKHVPLVTQARLYLPQILPCVRLLLWIDIDAMVIHPLREMWDEWTPSMPSCGIVGRDGVDKLAISGMLWKLDIKDPHELWAKASGDRPGFNAGVMIMDLDKLRETKFTEIIASHWSFALGGNDQISMNMQCNGTHGQLDSTWNVFQNYPEDPVYQRPDEWKIVHFQGIRKPWVAQPRRRRRRRKSQHAKVWEEYTIPLVQAINGPQPAIN